MVLRENIFMVIHTYFCIFSILTPFLYLLFFQSSKYYRNFHKTFLSLKLSIEKQIPIIFEQVTVHNTSSVYRYIFNTPTNVPKCLGKDFKTNYFFFSSHIFIYLKLLNFDDRLLSVLCCTFP